MKKIAFILFFLVSCGFKNQQIKSNYFEGKIIYKNSVESKSPNIDASELQKMSGDYSIFYFKEGNFKQFYNADRLLEETYIRKDNKEFIKKDNSDTLFWYDVSKPYRKINKFIINKKAETILGIMCDELITYYDNKTISYYYNSDSLMINKDWFKDFNYENKNFVTREMETLFLKCKIENTQVIFSITASAIYHEKIENTFFSIPKNSILIDDQVN